MVGFENRRKVILCVDDEKEVLSILAHQIRVKFGVDYEIELANSGDEALEIIEELDEDGVELMALITDQIMPGMKGDELIIKIHQMDPEVPKILLTGQASIGAVQNAINNGSLFRYISKPWEANDLILTLDLASKVTEQKKQINQYKYTNRLLKSISKATLRISAKNNFNDLIREFKKVFHTFTQIDRFYLFFFDENDKHQLIISSDTPSDAEQLENHYFADTKEFLKSLDRNFPKEGFFVNGKSKFRLNLVSMNQDYGYIYAENRELKPISETQFELTKILKGQFSISLNNIILNTKPTTD